MTSKFKVGDRIRVSCPDLYNYGREGTVVSLGVCGNVTLTLFGDSYHFSYLESELEKVEKVEEVEEEMKIRMDKRYKTRNGYDVVILHVMPNNPNGRTIFGKYLRIESGWFSKSWFTGGKHHETSAASPWDLVEVKEIKEETLYIHRSKIGNVYVDENPNPVYTEEEVHRVVINESTLISE